MARDYIRLRATSDREQLLEECKERFGMDADAGAIDEAMRRALSFTDLSEQIRADVRADLKEFDMEYHRFGISTELRTK